MTYLWNYLL